MTVYDLRDCKINKEIQTIIDKEFSRQAIQSVKVTFIEQEREHYPGEGELVGVYREHVPFPFIIYVDPEKSSPELRISDHQATRAMELFFEDENMMKRGLLRKDERNRNVLIKSHVIDAREIQTLEFVAEENKYNKHVLDTGSM